MKAIIPCCEEVKFGKNGSDATHCACKLARSYTGRDTIFIATENPFISTADFFIGTTLVNDGIPFDETICKYSYNTMLGITYSRNKYFSLNEKPEITELEWMCDAFKPAAIFLDPSTVDVTKEKLQYIRYLCDKYNCLMMLDEVISGFRYNISGVQGLYGVIPDLASFSKGMGNGDAISAICGRKEIIDLTLRDYGNVFGMSGTFFANASDIAAAISTIKEVQDKNVPAYINHIGAGLCGGLQQAIDSQGMSNEIKFTPASRPCNPQLSFSNMELKTLFDQEMINQGILMPYIAPSLSHTDKEVLQTIKAAEKALVTCRKAINNDCVKESLLGGHCIKPVFRRC
jgi:glutamate-1-semialdehyde 2,1-aminomutase